MSSQPKAERSGAIDIRVGGLKPAGNVPIGVTMVADFKLLQQYRLISTKPLRRPSRTKPTND